MGDGDFLKPIMQLGNTRNTAVEMKMGNHTLIMGRGAINRNTRYGAGAPKGDLYMLNGKITDGKIRKD